jgi:hypothetical protein
MLLHAASPCVVLIDALAPADIVMTVRSDVHDHLLLLVLPLHLLLWLNSPAILDEFGLFRQFFLLFSPSFLIFEAHCWLIFLLCNHLPELIFSHNFFLQCLQLKLVLVCRHCLLG